MRILHISTRLILGGSQENTVLSCEGQARLGHDVHLAFGPIYGPEGSLLDRVQHFRTPDNRRIATHVVPNLIREISPFRDARCYFELKELIERLKPDIVHTHSSKAGILGRAAGWNAGCDARPAVVHTIHGPPFHQFQSKTHYNLYVASERFAARRCDTIVSVADAMTRQYLAEGIGRPEQYITVRSGMETRPFLCPESDADRDEVRTALGIAPDDFIIGTVARLAELKGHHDLLDALAKDLLANPNWKLLWVGDGWWRERLLKRARERGLVVAFLDTTHVGVNTPSSVRPPKDSAGTKPLQVGSGPQVYITGLVPPERIPSLIRAMDVLAHPSYREGLPRTVPQALLSCVCPVAYDVDGTGEVCRHLETGLVVQPGDLEGLRSAIDWCATHPEERQHLAARGQRECAQNFSAEKMVHDLEAVYSRAIEKRDQALASQAG